MNPSFAKPTYEEKLEFQRVTVSRYRTGAHNLMIEKGRRPPRVPQEERLCACNRDIQTVKHVILECPLLNEIRRVHEINDLESGIMNDMFLLEMEQALGIK